MSKDEITISLEEYQNLISKSELWDFYCGNAEFDTDRTEYDEDEDEYVIDPEAKIVIYTNKTVREEDDFLDKIDPPIDEESPPAELDCGSCSECKGCCKKEEEDV